MKFAFVFNCEVCDSQEPRAIHHQHYHGTCHVGRGFSNVGIGARKLIQCKEQDIVLSVVENLMEEAVLDTLLKNGLGLPSQPPELVHSMRKDPEHQVSPSKNSDKEHKRLAIS